MVMRRGYLTKSLFITALECPTKLFYSVNLQYANRKIEDSFLSALAEGGFQVGELAKCYFPGGHSIESPDYEEALHRTNELLKLDRVIIYEAVIRCKNLFIRTDILIKNKNQIELVEVKAKSIDYANEEFFLNRNGSISSEWKPYISDVAFQKYVLQNAFPNYKVSAFLMLADKQAQCPTDGLNQKFKIIKDASGRKKVVITQELTNLGLSEPILCRVNVDACCDVVYSSRYGDDGSMNFSEYVNHLSDCSEQNIKIPSFPSSVCAGCEFTASEEEEKTGLKSGYKECWKEFFGWEDEDFNEPTIFDIWNFRNKDQLIQRGCIKMADITEDDISPSNDSRPGISTSERQWLQVQKAQKKDESAWFDVQNMKREMDSWIYPLHFIDFETTMTAIPFNKGRRPYEGIAFQFSHHVVSEDGRIEHKGQYLNTTPGCFPNYDFVRHLMKELDGDGGSVFRYAAHENTYLNLIYKQLMDDDEEIADRFELCEFIRTITKSVKSSEEQWEGTRNMIDILALVKRYYYNPMMKGSNSIKQVLPAILNSSEYLQKKYSQPIYGSTGGIPSLNYSNWRWIEFEQGQVIDPYKLLPKMFYDVSEKELSLLSESDELRDGGAALTAYARMQFEEMSDYERTEIQKALLKYCELDTMAMVMIVESWKDMIN
jgi:hypothetical protein